MPDEKNNSNVEEVYLESAKKLRSSLPKFAISLVAVTLIWLFGSMIFVPLGKGMTIGNIEVSQIISIIIVITVVILIIDCFNEIRNTADAISGFIAYFVGSEHNGISVTRIKKWKKALRMLAYIILVSVFFILFKPIMEQIHPVLPGIVLILIVIAAVIIILLLVMVMGTEIEEAAKEFAMRFEKPPQRRQKTRHSQKTRRRKR